MGIGQGAERSVEQRVAAGGIGGGCGRQGLGPGQQAAAQRRPIEPPRTDPQLT